MAEATGGTIYLHTSPFQNTWRSWPKGSTRLYVAPRWQRNCWLNGEDVIRTVDPHGLTAGAFIAWEEGADWKFAEVTEADEWNLRLRVAGDFPAVDTELREARPLEGPMVPVKMEAFGIVGAALPQDPFSFVTPDVDTLPSILPDYSLPEVPESDDPNPKLPPLLPPASLDFGSFLFPTPMLPADLVKAAVEILLSIGAMVIPSTGEFVFKFIQPEDITAAAENIYDKVVENKGEWTNPNRKKVIEDLEEILTKPDVEESLLVQEISSALEAVISVEKPLLGVPKDPPLKAVVAPTVPRYVIDGSAEKVDSGDWVVGQFSGGLHALLVKSISLLTGGETPETHWVEFEDLAVNVGELQKLFGDFRGPLEAEGSDVNETDVDPKNIELDADEMPESLKPGRPVLLTSEGEGPDPLPATVVDVDETGVTTDPPPVGFTKGNLVIRANVVGASHGATKPAKRLGSGVVAAGYHSLFLEVENVSSVPDPTFPGGTRADIDVAIDGMTWAQVPRLNDSGPTDSHYAVRATEERQLRLVFGDGRRGRHLPVGANNVRVGHRMGAGRSGNLLPGSLTKQANPNPFVAAVLQPLSSAGGEEMESVLNMREKAPATLLALERSVSLVDFENLAASRNDIWQAKAFHHPYQAGFFERVRVVVVPSGGGDLEPPLQDAITAFLSENAVPTVSVEVVGFTHVAVALTVAIRVDPAKFIPTMVAEQVRAALLAVLAIERRQIGRPLYISDVYHVVEGITGVADSKCTFKVDPTARLFPQPKDQHEEQLVYLDEKRPEDLELTTEGYVP